MLRFILKTMIALLLMSGAAGAGGERVALVIGNSAYQFGDRLENPANDARAMAESLARLGFDVHQGYDLDKSGMEKLIQTFSGASEGAELALVYYAGHGVQVSGQNYLLPVDAAPRNAGDLEDAAVRTDLLMGQINRNTRYRIVILDACRDNPFPLVTPAAAGSGALAIGPGLAEMAAPPGGNGALIVFATDPGNIALDGADGNSPFTAALLRHIETPDTSILTMLTHVTRDVAAHTGGKQRPWMAGSLSGEVYLASSRSLRKTAIAELLAPGTDDRTKATTPAATAPAAYAPTVEAVDLSSTAPDPEIPDSEPTIESRLTAATTALIAAPPAKNRAVLETVIASDVTEEALALGSRQHRAVQRRLALLGFDTGQADGVAGPNTRKAIARWQADNKFFESGYLNEPQYAELVRQSNPRYTKWKAEMRRKLALSRSLAKRHAGRRSENPVERFLAFLSRKFTVTEPSGPTEEAASAR